MHDCVPYRCCPVCVCGSWSVAGAVGTFMEAVSRCVLAVYTSYQLYIAVWTRERPPVHVRCAICKKRLISAHLGLDPATNCQLTRLYLIDCVPSSVTVPVAVRKNKALWTVSMFRSTKHDEGARSGAKRREAGAKPRNIPAVHRYWRRHTGHGVRRTWPPQARFLFPLLRASSSFC